MRPDPLHDAMTFLTRPGWFTPVFWVLLLAAVAIAVLAWRRDPMQRGPRSLGVWGLRILMGTMWWQQTLWKIPPNFDGLKFWMQQQVDHAADFGIAVEVDARRADTAERPCQGAGTIVIESHGQVRIEMHHDPSSR